VRKTHGFWDCRHCGTLYEGNKTKGLCHPCWLTKQRIRQYGITLSEYDAFFIKHNGLCHICKDRDATCIDHCHATGAVRGLLCYACNSALGHFRDDLSIIASALEYLS
jgi:Recombination endonuclease VII